MSNERRIVCAAIKNERGDIILGVRHWDEIMTKCVAELESNLCYEFTWKQGFVDNKGLFLSRKPAYEVASKSNQLIVIDKKKLYSEHIY